MKGNLEWTGAIFLILSYIRQYEITSRISSRTWQVRTLVTVRCTFLFIRYLHVTDTRGRVTDMNDRRSGNASRADS
jgi:hypothetical protein